jgi:YD repeat-containing protein
MRDVRSCRCPTLYAVVTPDTHARSFLTYAYGYDYDWNLQSYSALGNRTSVTVTGSSSFIQNGTAKYVFDGNRQLTSVTRADGSIWTYDYDALGNRVRVGGANGLIYYQYSYYQNANSKNTQRLRSGVGPVFAYDANGNVVTEGGRSYTWDVSNRLVGSAGAKYVYDYMDRLAQYLPPSAGPTVRNITLGQDTIAERSTDLTRTNDYLFGPGIDEPLAKRASDGTISYYAIDGQGSVVATTDSSAQISRSAAFDEWGALFRERSISSATRARWWGGLRTSDGISAIATTAPVWGAS